MTGGTAVILGEVGQNFAAGMSGGIAFVYDEYHTIESRCNREMVKIETPSTDDLALIRSLIEEHVRYTASPRGIKMLYRSRFYSEALQEGNTSRIRACAEYRGSGKGARENS